MSDRNELPREPEKNLRVMSHGAGWQTTALALMACHGEIEPFDLVVFADTQNEPEDVYKYLVETTWPALEKAGIPFVVVTKGDIAKDSLTPEKRFASMPLYTYNPTGGKGQLRRQCTNEYKIRAVRSQTWRLYNEHKRKRRVSMIFGISWEEPERMADPDVKYIDNVYPLVDLKITRDDCLEWITGHGYPPPEKSACIICPYRRDRGWLRMKRRKPAEFEHAASFDESIREQERMRGRFDGQVYLHDSRIPLRQHIERLEAQGALFPDDDDWRDDGAGCGIAGYCGR